MARAGQRTEAVWVWLVASALTVLVGCADDPEDTPDEELAESLAHDIDIGLVELNQGVAIPIARDGDWIAPQDRTAPVVMGREAIVRVHWTVEPEFEARPITVRLLLERSDLDEPIVIEQSEMISADGSADLTIGAADMLPGLRFRVELLEQDRDYAELPPPEIAPVSPRDLDSAPIGVRPESTAIKLVLVPLTLQWSGCSTSVDLGSLVQLYDDMAFQKSPTQALTTEVREPLVITTEPASIVDLLEPVQQLRAAEQGDPAAYYYGVYEPCGTLVDDLDGVAPIAHPDPAAGWLRVGVGIFSDDPQRSADVFMHQLGHLEGLAHVECPGTEATDPYLDYPYESGLIGVWGFGLRDGMVREAESAHDFMSYCYDGNWSSDWTWAKAFERIAMVSSWDSQAAQVSEGTVLLGWIGADGNERWWTTRGRIPAEVLEADPVAAVARKGERVEAMVGARLRLPDAEGELIGVELGDEVPDAITLVGATLEVPSEALARARGE